MLSHGRRVSTRIPGRKKSSTDDNYIIVKYKKLQKLKSSFTQLRERRKIDLESNKNEFSLFQTIANVWQRDFNEVNDYWREDSKKSTNKLDDIRTYSALILQHAFKYWTTLAKLRRRLKELRTQQQKDGLVNILKMTAPEKDMIEKRHREEEEAKKQREKRFGEFCRKLAAEGIQAELFNTYDGSTKKTTLRFDKQYRKLLYNGGGFFASSILLNTIYHVGKGLPETLRAIAPMAHNPWCVHIKATGIEIFLQAISGDDARMLHEGLLEIHRQLFTMYSFFVDEKGVLRRKGPSIISKAISNSSNNVT